jgi:hypothetical protein
MTRELIQQRVERACASRSTSCLALAHLFDTCMEGDTNDTAPGCARHRGLQKAIDRDNPCNGATILEDFRVSPEGEGSTHRSRKEVIQPQVPLRLPCYDFAPVTALAFGGLVLVAQVPTPTSGARSFHGVTGGVYKARERIHRGAADPRLLAIPASCSRVADYNPN